MKGPLLVLLLSVCLAGLVASFSGPRRSADIVAALQAEAEGEPIPHMRRRSGGRPGFARELEAEADEVSFNLAQKRRRMRMRKKQQRRRQKLLAATAIHGNEPGQEQKTENPAKPRGPPIDFVDKVEEQEKEPANPKEEELENKTDGTTEESETSGGENPSEGASSIKKTSNDEPVGSGNEMGAANSTAPQLKFSKKVMGLWLELVEPFKEFFQAGKGVDIKYPQTAEVEAAGLGGSGVTAGMLLTIVMGLLAVAVSLLACAVFVKDYRASKHSA